MLNRPPVARAFALVIVLLAAGAVPAGCCRDTISTKELVRWRESPVLTLELVNQTGQTLRVEPVGAEQAATEGGSAGVPDELMPPGQSFTVSFRVAQIIRIADLRRPGVGQGLGMRPVAAAGSAVLDGVENAGFVGMDGPAGVVRIRDESGDLWPLRIALDDCVFGLVGRQRQRVEVAGPPDDTDVIFFCD